MYTQEQRSLHNKTHCVQLPCIIIAGNSTAFKVVSMWGQIVVNNAVPQYNMSANKQSASLKLRIQGKTVLASTHNIYTKCAPYEKADKSPRKSNQETS
jgi:hypothetical protein